MSSSTSSSDKDSPEMLGNVPVTSIFGSMLYFKKRAGEYLDELQKERKVQAELKWELEVNLIYCNRLLRTACYTVYLHVQ